MITKQKLSRSCELNSKNSQGIKHLTFESVPKNTITKKMTVYHKSLSISMYNTIVHRNYLEKEEKSYTLVLNIFYSEERHTKSLHKYRQYIFILLRYL